MDSLKKWLNGTKYEVIEGTDEVTVSDVIFDSRKAAPGTVFVCMKGSRTDSHDFMPDVIGKGCMTFVVEKDPAELPEAVRESTGLNIIRTSNARRTLAFLSAARFGYPARRMKMIGLTGTKGKTSTSYMMKKVLETCGKKAGVIGTNGAVIGDTHFDTKNTTPDSYELNGYFAKMLEAGCEYCIMECSSQGFKMDRTAGIFFDYGLFLNLSLDHVGPLEHESFDEYESCKAMLFAQCGTAVVNSDDTHTDEMLKKADGYRETGIGFDGVVAGDPERPSGYTRTVRFSMKDKSADLYAHDLRFEVHEGFAGTLFKVGGLMAGSYALSIPGDFNVMNVLSVLGTAACLGLPADKVKEALSAIHVDGRMEVVYKSSRFSVIVDYAHNSVSMINLIKTLRLYNPKRLVIVFGCGGNRARERREGMGRSAAESADFSIMTADNSRFEKTEDIIADIEASYLASGGNPKAYVKIPDRREAIRYAMENALDGDMIAVIGKGHEDYQEENGHRRHFLDREEILKIKDELRL